MDPLSERVESEGFEENFDLKGDGDCIFNAAAFHLNFFTISRSTSRTKVLFF